MGLGVVADVAVLDLLLNSGFEKFVDRAGGICIEMSSTDGAFIVEFVNASGAYRM